jgi:hypothetical protein
MRVISTGVRKKINADPFYHVCSRWEDGSCDGRITLEHTLIYAGKQIDEVWAIIPLCTYHHAVNEYQDGGDLQKDKNIWIALNRATDDELRKYSKAVDYILLRGKLNNKYGNYKTYLI